MCQLIKNSEVRDQIANYLDGNFQEVKKNAAKQQSKTFKKTQANTLKQKLIEALAQAGLTDMQMFSKFDSSGDGLLSQMELECAFAVLGIKFSYDDLKRFIALTDIN